MSKHQKGGQMPDWDDMQTLWRETPPVDMARLARNARWVWWRMRFNFALEVGVCVAGIVLILMYLDFSGSADMVFGSVGMLYCMLGLWGAARIRAGAWGQGDGSARALVDLQIRRARSGILYVQLNSWGGIFGLLLVPLGYWKMLSDGKSLADPDYLDIHLLFGGLVVFVILFPILARPYVRRQRSQIADLEAVIRELDDEASTVTADNAPDQEAERT